MGTPDLLILISLTLAGLFTVMTASLLRAGIGLAVTSAILTMMMFRLDAPLAAVFELSVCAGLIPVIFITVISLTKPLRKDEAAAERKEKFHRFWALPVIIALLAVALLMLNLSFSINARHMLTGMDVQRTIWMERQLDVIGQVLILLAGAIGILVLFKETRKK